MDRLENLSAELWWKRRSVWYCVATASVVVFLILFFTLRSASDSTSLDDLTDAERSFVVERNAYGGKYELDVDGHITRLSLEGVPLTPKPSPISAPCRTCCGSTSRRPR